MNEAPALVQMLGLQSKVIGPMINSSNALVNADERYSI